MPVRSRAKTPRIQRAHIQIGHVVSEIVEFEFFDTKAAMSKREWHNIYIPHKHSVLLDRDGVINRNFRGGHVTSWKQFEFLPCVLDALRLLAAKGYTALVISNQACVGEGALSEHELDAITRRFLLEVALTGGNIGQVYYCRHKEADRCSCRKPLPGLIMRTRMEHRFFPSETSCRASMKRRG